jgi:hypothetical protein
MSARRPSAKAFCSINIRRTSGWRMISTRGAVLSAARVRSAPCLRSAGVGQRVAVRGRQRGHRLGGNAHARVLDDVEHLARSRRGRRRPGGLGTAWVAPRVSSHVAEALMPILCSTLVTKAPLRAPSEPSSSTQNLGTRNMPRPLVPGRRALGPRQHQVHDVLRLIEVAVGDEALHALEVVLVAGDVDGLGGAGADVGASVGLGEHHRPAPAPLEEVLQVAPLLLLGAELVDDLGVEVPEQVERQGRVGPRQELEPGPRHRRRRAEPAQVLGQLELVPAVLVVGLEGPGEAGRQGHVASAVEVDADPIALGEAGRELAGDELGQTLERGARAVGVEAGERAVAQDGLVDREHLEQVEEGVAEVGEVVAGHGGGSVAPPGDHGIGQPGTPVARTSSCGLSIVVSPPARCAY